MATFRLSPAPEKSAKFTWTFKLVHIQPEKRTYYFAAYSEREMNVSAFISGNINLSVSYNVNLHV